MPIPTRSRPTSKIIFNRGLVAENGKIPANLRFIQDSYPLKVLESKPVVSESISEAAGREIKALRITGIFQKADEYNQNGRRYPLGVIQEAVNTIQSDVGERGVMGEFDHPCLTTPDFRVLTTNGWKDFRDIEIGETVYSRVDGKMVPSRVNGIVDKPFEGEVFHFEGRHIDATFTGDHKMILDGRSDRSQGQVEHKVSELFSNREKFNKYRIPRTAEWTGYSCESYVIPGVKDLARSVNYYKSNITSDLILDAKVFVSFLGIWLAEGATTSNHGVVIYQNDGEKADEIAEMLKGFPSELKWKRIKNYFYLSDARLRRYVDALGDKYTKYIPSDVKGFDTPLLQELVYWFRLGDGRNKHGRNNVFTVSRQLIDDLHECHVKTGGCCYEMIIEPKVDYQFAGHVITATRKKVLNQLTLSTTSAIHLDSRFLNITPEPYVGNVYCLITEHGSFYMQLNGCSFWTGNCDAKLHLDRVSHLITKLWMEGKYVYGVAEVLEDMPCGGPLATLLRNKVRVGISSRGVGDMEEVVSEGMSKFEVQPGYQFVTWDVVGEPSVKEATMNMMESRNRLVKPPTGLVTRANRPMVVQGQLIRELANYLNANRLK
jgi:hypothetical protein